MRKQQQYSRSGLSGAMALNFVELLDILVSLMKVMKSLAGRCIYIYMQFSIQFYRDCRPLGILMGYLMIMKYSNILNKYRIVSEPSVYQPRLSFFFFT